MIANRLDGRTAIVTGAASGIGRGIAKRFGEEGATVVVADIQRDPKEGELYPNEDDRPTDELVEAETDSSAQFIETDVGDPESVREMVEETAAMGGGIDVLVNNAGVFIPGDSQSISIDDWETVIGVDLDGAFYCAKYAIPYLKERSGHLINIGSVNSEEGGGGPPYASAKGAIINLTRDLAVELGEYEVNVNTICPGFIETPIQDYQTEESLRTQLDQTLLPEPGVPEDVGDVAVFLASEESRFVHGASLYVDGGWTAHSL